MKPQQERDGDGRRRKSHDDCRNDQRLRNRIAAQARRGTPPGDDAEQQEDAGAEQIEPEELAQRMRAGDEAIDAKPGQGRNAS